MAGGNLVGHLSPEVIASWPKPNYVDPVRRTWFPILGCVWLGVATLFLSGRFWMRISGKGGGLGMDDGFIFAGWLGLVGFVTTGCIASVSHGMDRHIWDVVPTTLWQLVYLEFISQILYLAATGLIKISVLLFYRRLTAGTSKADRVTVVLSYAAVGGIAFVAAYCSAFILALLLGCQPLEAYWRAYDPTWEGTYSCIGTTALNWVSGVLSIVTDAYAIVLPCIVLGRLRYKGLYQKVAIHVLFCLSLLTIGAGIARTYYQQTLPQHSDTTWYSFYDYVAATIEIALGIICASAPSVRLLLRVHVKEPLRHHYKSRGSRNQTSDHSTSPADSRKSEYRQIGVPLGVLPTSSFDSGRKNPLFASARAADVESPSSRS